MNCSFARAHVACVRSLKHRETTRHQCRRRVRARYNSRLAPRRSKIRTARGTRVQGRRWCSSVLIFDESSEPTHDHAGVGDRPRPNALARFCASSADTGERARRRRRSNSRRQSVGFEPRGAATKVRKERTSTRSRFARVEPIVVSCVNVTPRASRNAR